MLEDCLFASRLSARSKKPATLALSVLIHGTLAGALILIPLFQSQVLPQISIFSPLRPPETVRAVELVPTGARPQSALSATTKAPAALIAPEAIPSKIAIVADEPASSTVGFLSSSGGGRSPFGGPFGDFPGLGEKGAAPPLPPPPPPVAPAPPPAPAAAPQAPIRRGGEVVQSNLVYTVKPTYPRLAAVTHTQGIVVLEAVITREGTIDASRLRVITGHPLLTPAAVEAVQQWRYRPTLLNGEPVEVLTTITVNFTLN